MPLKNELVPKPRQKRPNVSSEILEEQHFSTVFFDRFCCLRLLAIKQQSPPGQGTLVPSSCYNWL